MTSSHHPRRPHAQPTASAAGKQGAPQNLRVFPREPEGETMERKSTQRTLPGPCRVTPEQGRAPDPHQQTGPPHSPGSNSPAQRWPPQVQAAPATARPRVGPSAQLPLPGHQEAAAWQTGKGRRCWAPLHRCPCGLWSPGPAGRPGRSRAVTLAHSSAVGRRTNTPTPEPHSCSPQHTSSGSTGRQGQLRVKLGA